MWKTDDRRGKNRDTTDRRAKPRKNVSLLGYLTAITAVGLALGVFWAAIY